MATFTQRNYTSWQVAAKDASLKIKKTFLEQKSAKEFRSQLESSGIVANLKKTQTLAWQVRVRKVGFPALTQTFAGIRPIDAPAFIVAQLAGAALALVLASLLLERRAPVAAG